MDIRDFPNPKLNLSDELKKSGDKTRSTSLAAVDGYLLMVGKYIHTDIDLNYDSLDVLKTHAWILRIVSSLVLRSLYLRNEFAESINAGNAVGFFLPLKAWFEVAGALAYIYEILQKDLSPKDLFREIEPFALGDRGNGELRIGKVEAKNVLTMIEKGNKYLEKIRRETEGGKKNNAVETFFTDYYDGASNASHPSFSAHEIVGRLDGFDGVWRAKTPEKISNVIAEDLPAWGGLLMTPLFIDNICHKIFELEKGNFVKIKSKKYFI